MEKEGGRDGGERMREDATGGVYREEAGNGSTDGLLKGKGKMEGGRETERKAKMAGSIEERQEVCGKMRVIREGKIRRG